MALISISVIPFGGEIHVFGTTTWMQLTDLNIGVLFILAISSVGVYGIALAGWASNNKYSLLGGLRSSAQMISYELPLSIAIVSPLLLVNTLSLREMVTQAHRDPSCTGNFALAGAADRQLLRIPDRRIRRNQPRALRLAGSRERAGGRISHRIQQHEIRGVLHGGIRQHGHRLLHDRDSVPGRLAAVISGRRGARTTFHVDLRGRRTDRDIPRTESGASKFDRITLPIIAVVFLLVGAVCSWSRPYRRL